MSVKRSMLAKPKMPMLSREGLALKLRQNWMAKHPIEAPALDDSLTSLNWLQNLNIMKITAPTPPASPCPLPDPRPLRVNPNAVLNMTNNILHIKQEPTDTPCVPCVQEMVNPPVTTDPVDAIDYKTNAFLKPPYSYATLICMAMKEHKKNKITLSGIYNWITENFMYYRTADPSWQNSIRHNLSLNKCFQKVPRRKDEPGKGGFWRINPEYMDLLENGILKKRRASTRENIDPGPSVKRIKTEMDSWMASSSPKPTLSQINSGPSKSNTEAKYTPGKPSAAHDNFSEGLDFSWSSILNQDIDVGGIKIKTEDIIKETELAAESITNFSPPPSSDGSSDITIEELFNTGADFTGGDEEPGSSPVDLSSGNNLDLTVFGTGIRPPEWWNESFNGGSHSLGDSNSHAGLHTPIAASPQHTTEAYHPWAEDKSDLSQAMGAFDIDLQDLLSH